MNEPAPDPHEVELRAALRELREDTPQNALARQSLLAAVEPMPALLAAALEELAWPQAEFDLHLSGEGVVEHSTRADWLGRFVTRVSTAVNEVTKSMSHKKRLTPGLLVLAPSPGSVRVVLRAPLPPKEPQTDNVVGADDTTAESRALGVVANLFKLSEEEVRDESPLTAAVQSLSPQARQRLRAVTRSVIDADWRIDAELVQRGHRVESVTITPRSAKRLRSELDVEVTTTSQETLQGTIDGQRHSLSTMWFVPVGQARAYEVAVSDFELLTEVTRLSAIENLRVECTFNVFMTVPAGASEATLRSRELVSIREVEGDPTLD